MIVSNIDKYFKEMDIDISWYKKSFIPNTQLSSKSLDDIAISVENCVKCELSKTRKRTVFGLHTGKCIIKNLARMNTSTTIILSCSKGGMKEQKKFFL